MNLAEKIKEIQEQMPGIIFYTTLDGIDGCKTSPIIHIDDKGKK